MPMTIAIPPSIYPRLGPGCTLTISGMTGAAAGHKLSATVSHAGVATVLTFGGVLLAGSSGSAQLVLGLLGPGYTTVQGLYYFGQVGIADGAAVDVFIDHLDSSNALLESVTITGRVWDATSWITTLFHYGIIDQSGTLAAILAAVRHTFVTP